MLPLDIPGLFMLEGVFKWLPSLLVDFLLVTLLLKSHQASQGQQIIQ